MGHTSDCDCDSCDHDDDRKRGYLTCGERGCFINNKSGSYYCSQHLRWWEPGAKNHKKRCTNDNCSGCRKGKK
jgi:hypothetical protein